MSLDNDAVDQRVKSWKGFQDSLRSEDKEQFMQMMNYVYKYAQSINATPEWERDSALLLSLLFYQHNTIEWLKKENKRLKKKAELD